MMTNIDPAGRIFLAYRILFLAHHWFYYPHAFVKNEWDIVIVSVRPSVRLSVCLSVCPSVCPLCYLLLNYWTKFNQIWCVSYSHKWGVQRQTLCVFSQMKDTKHIRWDFHSVAWVMPQGWDFGVPRGSIFFSNMVMWHIKLTEMTSRMQVKFLS